MGKELVEVKRKISNLDIQFTEPALPENWNYDTSIKKVRQLVYKWCNLTDELCEELWIAREILSRPGRPPIFKKTGANAPVLASWGTYCKDIHNNKSTVNRWIKRWLNKALPRSDTPSLPKGKYGVIYADPPWRYDFCKDSSDTIEQHYPTMEIEEIKSLQIPTIKNAVLYLWATAPKLSEALEVIENWGFTYKTNMVWDKDWIGMGYWFRGRHEHLLVAVKGDVSPPIETDRKASVYKEKRQKHSKKPITIRKWIEKWHPNAKKIELFAREEVNGWTSWGNEI